MQHLKCQFVSPNIQAILWLYANHFKLKDPWKAFSVRFLLDIEVVDRDI